MQRPRAKSGPTDERHGEAGLSSRWGVLECQGLHVDDGASCHGSWLYSSKRIVPKNVTWEAVKLKV